MNDYRTFKDLPFNKFISKLEEENVNLLSGFDLVTPKMKVTIINIDAIDCIFKIKK
jgi:hypothetical protein